MPIRVYMRQTVRLKSVAVGGIAGCLNAVDISAYVTLLTVSLL
jgi:hypothetical protein